MKAIELKWVIEVPDGVGEGEEPGILWVV